jgi:diguanylate cyclase (GGDEF)-like protein
MIRSSLAAPASLEKTGFDTYLVAEDNPADAELVTEMLNQAFDGEYSVLCVDRFEKLKSELMVGAFKALILDMNLPDQSGLANIEEISRNHPNLPIVVLTGHDDMQLAINSLKKGAQDYLSKNQVTPELLSRSLRYAQERKQIELRLKKALEDTAHRNTQLEALARHDFLTSLPNRAYFHSVAGHVLLRAKRSEQAVALLYFDLNGFKKVNDNYGHDIGDELLRQVAARLKDTVRDSDFLARLGGDEFVILTDLLAKKQEVYKLVNRLLGGFERPFTIGSHQIHCGPSIGISYFPDASSLDLLVKQADCAMYEAKSKKNVSVCFYTPQVERTYARNFEIESKMSEALEKAEFDAHFQTVHSVANPSEISVEALLRWHSPTLGNVRPADFIPLSENNPLINEMTKVVVEQCYLLKQALVEIERPLGKIAINLCAYQLSSSAFCQQLLDWLDNYDLPPEKICLELTERQIVKNSEQCAEQIKRLRDKGIQFSLDDFGAGYASITHLLELPMDYLKLDRSLISHIDQNPRNRALVAGIIETAHRLNMKVIAEGIEREQEHRVALSLSCDYLQGYYFSRPLPVDELACHYIYNERSAKFSSPVRLSASSTT